MAFKGHDRVAAVKLPTLAPADKTWSEMGQARDARAP